MYCRASKEAASQHRATLDGDVNSAKWMWQLAHLQTCILHVCQLLDCYRYLYRLPVPTTTVQTDLDPAFSVHIA